MKMIALLLATVPAFAELTMPSEQVIVQHVTAQVCATISPMTGPCRQNVAVLIVPDAHTRATGYTVQLRYTTVAGETQIDTKPVLLVAGAAVATWLLDDITIVSITVQPQGPIGPAVEIRP
jgi:hypothetical protein